MRSEKYDAYFDVDEDYFPTISDSSIKKGEESDPDFWMRTYPHATFIDALKKLERILNRVDKKSLWLEGAYGSGKSQCAYALRRILEVPREKLQKYWGKYDALKKESVLLQKLIECKERGVLTVYRSSTSEINDNRKLFFAVQESVLKALKERGCKCLGSATLRESVVEWLSRDAQKTMFDALLKDKYSSFPYRSTDEVLERLRGDGDVGGLIEEILKIGDAEGITAFELTVDALCDWLKDVIAANKLQIVFIWDEFSEYFQRNENSWSSFQRLVELNAETPFFIVPITHEMMHYSVATDPNWRKLRDRFLQVEIKLPDSVAFELIACALAVREGMGERWCDMAEDLNSRLGNSRRAVASLVRVDERTMKNIMPIHPSAAVALKYIASTFKSNQRSMFDFIKTVDDGETQAFQWFIKNYGPEEERPLLTIDMLWNFFYEKGRRDLDRRIADVLDGYESRRRNLREEERVILKAILTMQALDCALNGSVPLFHATEENLRGVFEGTPCFEGARSCNIANQMIRAGVLFKKKIDKKTEVYAVEMSTGDQARIDEIKDRIRNGLKTSRIVDEAGARDALALGAALNLRFERIPGTGEIAGASFDGWTRELNDLCQRGRESWRFAALAGFATRKDEAEKLRAKIRESAARREYRDVVLIDASATFLSDEQIEDYVEFSALAEYYQGADRAASSSNAAKAKEILREWKRAFEKGRYVAYYNGEDWRCGSAEALRDVLREIVTTKFRTSFDFDGLTDNMLKATQTRASVKNGLEARAGKTSGVVVGIEKKVFSTAEILTLPDYWKAFPNEKISKIKIALDETIAASFKRNGQIALSEIWNFLQDERGFARCNCYSFLTGFLLKEYGEDRKLRFSDSRGLQCEMNVDSLSDALRTLIDGQAKNDSYIVKQTPEERAFYDVLPAWGAPKNCSSPAQGASAVSACLLRRGFPLRFIANVVGKEIYEIAERFVDLHKSEGDAQLEIAREIGAIALKRRSLGDELKEALKPENFSGGAELYLRDFDGGELWDLAEKIGAQTNILSDVKTRFTSVKHQALWNDETQDEELRNLAVEYAFANATNEVLRTSTKASSKKAALDALREAARRIPFSIAQAAARCVELENFIDALSQIIRGETIQVDFLKATTNEMKARRAEVRELLSAGKEAFKEVYANILENLNDEEIDRLRNRMPLGMLEFSTSECEAIVAEEAAKISRLRLKARLAKFWFDKTGTRSPIEWSQLNKTPILCMIPDEEFEDAKRAFETLNKANPEESEIDEAFEYLQSADFFRFLNDEDRRRDAFERAFLKSEGARRLVTCDQIREVLQTTSVRVYDWFGNPGVESLARNMVDSEYRSQGVERVLLKIDNMNETKLKSYLKRLVKENATVGLEILGDDE